MKLSQWKGNTLKVYLALIEERNGQEVCPLSHRVLGQRIGLARNTLLQALRQLEQQGLILREEGGWRATTAPLVGLLASRGGSEIEPPIPGGGSEIEPHREERAGGSEIEPPTPGGGSKTEPAPWGGGSKTEPPGPMTEERGSEIEPPGGKNRPPGSEIEPLTPRHGSKIEPRPEGVVQKLSHPAAPPTRPRTLWSSSSEEDSICTAVPPSSSLLSSPPPGAGEGEGGVGGEKPEEGEKEGTTPPEGGGDQTGEKRGRTILPGVGRENPGAKPERPLPPSDYLSQMQSWWDAIWPDNREEEIPWFGQLWAEFGAEIPVQVLRQFAEGGKTLGDLTYPDRFPNYFRVCCRNAQQPSPSPQEKAERAPEKAPSPGGPRPVRPEGNGQRPTRSFPEKPPSPAAAVWPPAPAVGRPSRPEGHGRPPPSPRAGHGQHPRAEASADPPSPADGEPARADGQADADRQRAVALRKLMVAFLEHPEAPPHTRDPRHFLSPFREERRRP